MEIMIMGKPIAKARPRFVRRGAFVGTYNPQETEEGRWILEAKGQIQKPLEGPLSMICRFDMPIPSGMRKTDIRRIEAGEMVPHSKKPDLDNCLKFVKDCLNGIAWKDDSQVWWVQALKRYSTDPKTVILIYAVS